MGNGLACSAAGEAQLTADCELLRLRSSRSFRPSYEGLPLIAIQATA